MKETEYYLFWYLLTHEGYTANKWGEKTNSFLRRRGIYQVYGRHSVHGLEALLYIGSAADRTLAERLDEQYRDWIKEEQQILFRIGHLTERDSERIIENSSDILDAEAALIQYCTPCYNTKSKVKEEMKPGIRIFNAGEYGALPTEISWRWWTWGKW